MSTTKENADVDAVVFDYLNKKGYASTANLFKQESKLGSIDEIAAKLKAESDASVYAYIMFFNQEENTASKYAESYSRFRDWIYSSLDAYKGELLSILFPVFVHCYLDMLQKGFPEAATFMDKYRKDHDMYHSQDLNRLQAVMTAQHMGENELVKIFRNNKYIVKLCQYSHDLVVKYLQDSRYMLLMAIINQYLDLQVTGLQPTTRSEKEVGHRWITGSTEKQISDLHKRDVLWGLLDLSEPKPEADKQKEEGKEGKEGKESKKEKKKKAEKESEYKVRSLIPVPKMNEETEEAILDDIKKRVSLSSTALPSVCFYTFFNTHQSLNCMTMSKDGSLVAAGFSDSSIRLWDLKKDQQIKISNASSYPGSRPRSSKKSDKGDYTLLLGHSGPVYALTFSPDNQFLISCSEDNTARLWNLEMKYNLVCYKGHNYPVWDVEFSPYGYYFATASHDRTARLWTTDRISPLRIFSGHLSDVECVKFHPNCNYLATGSSDKSVRLWEINTGECVRIFTGHHSSVLCLAFSPNGKYLASGGEDKMVMLWDIATANKIATFTGHTKMVWSVDFSGEGNLLASGSADNTVRLWDVTKATKVSSSSLEEEESLPPLLLGKRQAPASNDSNSFLIATLPTKSTPVTKVMFTYRNLLLASGPFTPSSNSSVS